MYRLCIYLEVNKIMIKDIYVYCVLNKVRVLRFRDIICKELRLSNIDCINKIVYFC